MYVNSDPLNYPACIWRTTGTPGPLWRHTACHMLPALSAPGHSSLGPKPIRLQGCDNSLFFFLKKFYFLKLINFSWRISTLQYCDGFCYTSAWIGLRYTCVPHILNPHLLPPQAVPLNCPRALALGPCFMH